MACINADGTLTASAEKVLAALRTPATLPEVAQKTGLPLYRIRSSVRELKTAELLQASGDSFQATPAGLEKLSE